MTRDARIPIDNYYHPSGIPSFCHLTAQSCNSPWIVLRQKMQISTRWLYDRLVTETGSLVK